jgi:transposase
VFTLIKRDKTADKQSMELNEKQYLRIAGLLPTQRGNVKIQNHTLLSALLYRCENGCKWRALPNYFGNWHVIYVRLYRWSENGALDRVYAALADEGLLNMGVCALDSTSVKAHPDAHGAPKKTARRR